MKFEKAREKDIQAIKDLLAENDLPSEDIRGDHQVFFLLRGEGKILAVCGLEIYGRHGILRSFVVNKPERKTGIGTEIYQYTLSKGIEEGIKAFYLLTTTAAGFFEKMEWQKVERKAVPEVIKKSHEFIYREY